MIEKLKQRWNVRNGWDVLIILVVFACTGFSVLYVKRWLFDLIGLDAQSPGWLRWTVNILIILPLYQVILLIWGWIWGKFSFFWEFEKRMFSRIGGLFRRKSPEL
jgi:cellulose synthase/poly-beta-1,6-N-acetylglucosamine synthase-like glycosyltransferase